jgi:hypothetical protein
MEMKGVEARDRACACLFGRRRLVHDSGGRLDDRCVWKGGERAWYFCMSI